MVQAFRPQHRKALFDFLKHGDISDDEDGPLVVYQGSAVLIQGFTIPPVEEILQTYMGETDEEVHSLEA